jgi:hypothetical protein
MREFMIGARAALLVTLFTGAVMAAPPALQLNPAGGRASGLTPGGTSIWFVVSIGELGGMPLWSRFERVVPIDQSGVSTLDVAPQRRAVWVVVDLASGSYVVSTPGGGAVAELPARGNGFVVGADSQDFNATDLDALLVRPNVGAWTLRAAASGKGDADPRPGNLRIRFTDMAKFHGTEMNTPSVVLPSDLLVVVDRTNLRTYVRLGKEQAR